MANGTPSDPPIPSLLMQVHVSLAILLANAIVIIGFFSAGLLLFVSTNRQANRFLALLMFSISCWLIDGLFRLANIYGQNASLYFLPIFYSLGFGPLIYFYVRSLTDSQFVFTRHHAWHFLPVAIQASLYIVLSLNSYEFRDWFWQTIHYPVTYRIEFDGTWLSLLIYVGLSLRLLQWYRRYVQENFSETSQLTLRWLQVLLIGLVLICGQWTYEMVLRDRFNSYYVNDYSYWMLGVVLVAMGIVGLQQRTMEQVQFHAEATPAPPFTEKAADKVNPEYLERIRRAMNIDRLYLNPTLTLIELAQHVKLNPKVVSQVINTGMQQSFNDFVNAHRVSEVKQRLHSDDLNRFTLLGIALESGFNSKTTFNRIFKEHTGLSPSAFAMARS
ncbi:helix-turn-helix domain-containing protein [Spirosoma rhododendri]|uniref:Helix-turn-helix transcriptional regulator n=1 Tax=Spirosoma rhododendri TaxID=2728024 RepID=A0A7L5DLI2_9BACT|nr:AraC family transcriptional regulator [Spirosoma rhododendri]QJD77298.1 helix-turn-helix transcriptional regulator [Spirosoma rhododendri]